MFTPRLALIFCSLFVITFCSNASHAQDGYARSILSLGETAPKSTGTDLSNSKIAANYGSSTILPMYYV